MAYFLFIDESGQDHHESPYEVLAGIAVEDRDLWNLIQALREAELRHFGTRYTNGVSELKGVKLLRKKVYRLAAQLPAFPEEERREAARQCLQDGAFAGKREMTALAQAKLAYVREALDICAQFRCKAFASILPRTASVIKSNADNMYLRKDYAYLFERFFYFLEDKKTMPSGIIVFDELEKSQSHILIGQLESYYKLTVKGRQRASQIIPEPFFVHSDLTTGIQLADLTAYIISWGVRLPEMTEPAREEMQELADQVCSLRYRTRRDTEPRLIWSFTVIADLRSAEERSGT